MPTVQNPKSELVEQTRKPAAEFRDSNIRVTIWPNPVTDGIIRYNVLLSRSYQSDGKWKQTTYLGGLDLQRARKLLDRADDWIFNTSKKDREAEAA